MSTNSQTRKVGVIAAATAIAIIALMFAYPVIASAALAAPNAGDQATSTTTSTSATTSQSTTSTTTVTIQLPQPNSLTVGEQITLTSTQGEYRNLTTTVPPNAVGKSAGAAIRHKADVSPTAVGTAAGTITFAVTGVLREGYTLTLSSGTLSLGAISISLTGGSAVMGLSQSGVTGSGTAGVGGSMIYQGSSHSDFWGNTYSTFSLDLQLGGNEYLVQLLVTVSHS